MTAGSHSAKVWMKSIGLLPLDEDTKFVKALALTDFEPKLGSLSGGTKITLTGDGFPIDKNQKIQVQFGELAP